MVLKKQEDLHKLLEKYPLSDYSIVLRRGESDILHLSHADFSISWDGTHVILKDNTAHKNLIKVNCDGFDEIISNDDEYKFGVYIYNSKGIEVKEIYRITKKEECLSWKVPLMLNGTLVNPKNNPIQEKNIMEFYDDLQKFYHMCTYLKDELRMVAKRIQYDDELNNEGTLRTNTDLRIFRLYFEQSLSDYFALWYRKLIDEDKRDPNFNFSLIIKKGGVLGIIKNSEIVDIEREFESFRNRENYIIKHVNTLVAHMDKDAFNEYYKIRRTSDTGGIEFIKSTTNREKIIEELDKLIVFIDKTINRCFVPYIGFGSGGGYSEREYTLKILSNN